MNSRNLPNTLGIIGGGQLGKMMAQAASQLGMKTVVLDPNKNAPAAHICTEFIEAAFDDEVALQRFASSCDRITYELEHLPVPALEEALPRTVFPQGTKALLTTQDRLLEKQLFASLGLPTVRFAAIENEQVLYDTVDKFPLPAVLKTRTGGYDGKGQVRITSKQDVVAAATLLAHGPCLLEEFVAFEREVSCVVARNEFGEKQVYPLFENEHAHHILHKTTFPASTTSKVEETLTTSALELVDALDFIGVLAMEAFVQEDGTVLLNELAPRPHNSGHVTMEMCNVSQFEQHVRACMGWPLREITVYQPGVMVNLLGEHMQGYKQHARQLPDHALHLYGKEDVRQGRKMGHVTFSSQEFITIPSSMYEEIWHVKEEAIQ